MGKDRGLFKRGRTWCIQYFHGGKRYREAVSESKTEAKSALAARKTQIKEGKFYPGKKQEFHTSWEEFLPAFLGWAEKNLKPTSYIRYSRNMGRAKLTKTTV